MRKLISVLIAVAVLTMGLMIAAAPSASAQTPVSGTWSATGVSGSGTFVMQGQTIDIKTGTITWNLTYTGPISGSVALTTTYDDSTDTWSGSTPTFSGKLSTLAHTDMNAAYLGWGGADSFVVTQTTQVPPYYLDVAFNFRPYGSGGGATEQGQPENVWIIGEDTGQGSGTAVVRFNFSNLTWQVQNLSGSGNWAGYYYSLTGTPIVIDVDLGGGTATLWLDGTPVASVKYPASAVQGALALAEYMSNPGGTPLKIPLGRYVNMTTNVPFADGTVELRIYYTDAEVAAAGIDESTLVMYKWDGSQWVQCSITGRGVDANGKYVYAMGPPFSDFAPMGDPPTAQEEGCFIATAAYGSYLDSHVDTLRGFRDAYLKANPVGSSLVSLYYRTSPPIAKFIDANPAVKPVVRAALMPAVALSEVALHTTLAQKIAILAGTALVSVALLVCLRRWAFKRE